MIERCGCSSASSGLRRPWRTSSSTSEWSVVRRSSAPSRQAVAAAVADVDERHLAVADVRGGERRAHAGPVLVGHRQRVDALVRVLDDAARRSSTLPSPAGSPAAERVDRRAGRDLAGLRAAHAVGDREQRRAGVVGVLVRPALAAGVGALGVFGDAQHVSPPRR